jgi:hypothetical protein
MDAQCFDQRQNCSHLSENHLPCIKQLYSLVVLILLLLFTFHMKRILLRKNIPKDFKRGAHLVMEGVLEIRLRTDCTFSEFIQLKKFLERKSLIVIKRFGSFRFLG